MTRTLGVVCLLTAITAVLFGQHAVSPRNMYERVYAVVPFIGKGTWDDPKRPLFSPAQMAPSDRSGIIAFHYEMTDDGKFAITEFVFANNTTLAPALAAISTAVAATPSAKVFQNGKNTSAEIQNAFKLLKKDFDITKFTVRVP